MPKLVINSFDPNAEFEELNSEVEATGKSTPECSQMCIGYLFSVVDKVNSTCMDYSWQDDNGNTVARCFIFSGSELNTLQKLINTYNVFDRIRCKVLQIYGKLIGNNKLYIFENKSKL